MEITLNPEAGLELLRLGEAHKNEHEPRAPGMHVSHLIYCRTKSWYQLHGHLNEEFDEDTLLMFALGQGHHALFQQCIPEVPSMITLISPTGVEHSVVGTPDMNWPEHLATWKTMPVVPPAEIKTTRYSANKTPAAEMPHYVDQLASYCLARGSYEGRLYVLHLNGGYGRGDGGMRPKMNVYDIRFTTEEMHGWYLELGRRADQVVNGDGEGRAPYPDSTTHYTWECNYCPLNVSKGGICPAPTGNKYGWFLDESRPGWVPSA